MNIAVSIVLSLAVSLAGQSAASRPAPVTPSAQRPLSSLIEVELRADRTRYPINSPIPLEFIVRNITADPVELEVSLGNLAGKIPAGLPLSGVGLPIEHVFSGDNFRALSLAIEGDPYLGDRVFMPPSRTIPAIVLAPYAEVGLKYDIARNYPMLLREGRYELRWKPYGGQVQSQPLTIEVKPFKQVVMDTDAGRLTIRLLYDKAPKAVDNFLELVGQRFYDGLTFFLVDPNLAVQAGCTRGDGTSRRPDGRTMAPEFNDAPFEFGTVGMSLTRVGASDVDANSASCQFFITLSRQPGLDRRYTAFGQVEGPDSMETLRKIAASPRTERGLPVKPAIIRTATAVDAPVPPPATVSK